MSESKIRDRQQGPGSGEDPAAQAPSFCSDDMMRRMAEAVGCAPAMTEKAPSRGQPGAAAQAGGSPCCGRDADTEARSAGHAEAVV